MRLDGETPQLEYSAGVDSILSGCRSGTQDVVDAFTEPGDQVVIQTPVYPPFYSVVQDHGRELVHNPALRSEDGDYSMDFEDLEKSFSTGKVKMLILCSPHRPGGPGVSRTELERLASLCQQYDVLVVSDEIHADLVFESGAHTPFGCSVRGCRRAFHHLHRAKQDV